MRWTMRLSGERPRQSCFVSIWRVTGIVLLAPRWAKRGLGALVVGISNFCVLPILVMLPPQPSPSEWQLLDGPPKYVEAQQPLPGRWFWDAPVRAWRRDPKDFFAETPQQMACDDFTYLLALDAE